MKRRNYNAVLRMTGLKRDQSRAAVRHVRPRMLRATRGAKDRIAVILFVLVSMLLCVSPSACGANWTTPAVDLAKAITAATGPGTITLTLTNSSSIPKSDLMDIQHMLESQLRSSGIRIVSGPDANSDVHVTLSENFQGYLWVAETKQGNQTQVAMVSVARAEASAVAHSSPSMTIRKTLLWSQPAQILDVYVDDKRMVLLDASSVSTLSVHEGKWQREQSLAITAPHPFPRDLRGLLIPAKDHAADAYLPGTICNIATGSGIGVTCRDGDDPWPLGQKTALFNSSRNYFTDALSVYKSGGPFYSLASIPRSGYDLLVTTGVDGRVHLNDGANPRVLTGSTTADWGSDIAAVKSNCGGGTQLLVTSAGDDTVTDSLRAFEVLDREPVQVSAAADFPGPITALWTHGDGVTAVSHNLRTGSYEAYSVSVSCNQ